MAGSRLWTGEDKSRILSCAARERHGREAATTRAEGHDPGRFASGAPRCEAGAKRRRSGTSRDDKRQSRAKHVGDGWRGRNGEWSGARGAPNRGRAERVESASLAPIEAASRAQRFRRGEFGRARAEGKPCGCQGARGCRSRPHQPRSTVASIGAKP